MCVSPAVSPRRAVYHRALKTIERWTLRAATGLTAMACVAWLAESAARTQSAQDGMRQRR